MRPDEEIERRLQNADDRRRRAVDELQHTREWLVLDKPSEAKEAGSVPWVYDLREALVHLDAARREITYALEIVGAGS